MAPLMFQGQIPVASLGRVIMLRFWTQSNSFRNQRHAAPSLHSPTGSSLHLWGICFQNPSEVQTLMSHVERLSTAIHLKMKLQKPSAHTAKFLHIFFLWSQNVPEHFHWIIPLHIHSHFPTVILHLIKWSLQNCRLHMEDGKTDKLSLMNLWTVGAFEVGLHMCPGNNGDEKGYRLQIGRLCVFVWHSWRHLIPVLKYKHFFSCIVFLLL